VAAALCGIIVVATDEPVFTFCHVVVGWAAEFLLSHRVTKPYTEISYLQRLVNTLNKFLVSVPTTVYITDESYLHCQSQEI